MLLALAVFQGNAQKKYSNPVYGSDFPDPTVQRAPDGTFYAYATGCKARRSTDLINWSSVSNVISRPTWNDSTHADGTKDYYSLWQPTSTTSTANTFATTPPHSGATEHAPVSAWQ